MSLNKPIHKEALNDLQLITKREKKEQQLLINWYVKNKSKIKSIGVNIHFNRGNKPSGGDFWARVFTIPPNSSVFIGTKVFQKSHFINQASIDGAFYIDQE